MAREMAGNFVKSSKIREFSFNYIIIKEKLQSPFLAFFFMEKTKPFFKTFNSLQKISPKLYFLGVVSKCK